MFFWLLLHDRVNTRNLLQRKSMLLKDYNCVLCSDNTEETQVHLFWNCPFALKCWDHLVPEKQRGISAYDEITLTLTHLPGDISLDIIIIGCWGILLVRNDGIFITAAPHVNTWKYYLKERLWAAQIRVKHIKA